MTRSVKIILCLWLLVAACAATGDARPPGPPYYIDDAVPTLETINRTLESYYDKQVGSIELIGVHKVSDNEYLVLAGPAGGKGTQSAAKTSLYNLWRLESKEWVMIDPLASVVRYIKIQQLDKP